MKFRVVRVNLKSTRKTSRFPMEAIWILHWLNPSGRIRWPCCRLSL